MRSAEDIAEELERDRSSREAEVRLLERYLAQNDDEEESKALRRCIVVISYSHFEGFCKFALSAYLSAVNGLSISTDKICDALKAASMSDIFEALRNESSKHDLFRKTLPNDVDVHRLARRQIFVSSFDSKLRTRTASISDDIVDAKSNLNAPILKRNLFILGLQFDFVDEHKHDLNALLRIRNSVAHGDTLMNPSVVDLERFQRMMASVMTKVHNEVVSALIEKRYLRQAA